MNLTAFPLSLYFASLEPIKVKSWEDFPLTLQIQYLVHLPGKDSDCYPQQQTKQIRFYPFRGVKKSLLEIERK
jgi:hypothetical protein